MKRPAEDDGEEGTSKAKVANLKKLEEEAKQHERDNPQQGTSRQMQGKGRTIVYRVGRAPIVKFCRQFLICSSGRWANPSRPNPNLGISDAAVPLHQKG